MGGSRCVSRALQGIITSAECDPMCATASLRSAYEHNLVLIYREHDHNTGMVRLAEALGSASGSRRWPTFSPGLGTYHISSVLVTTTDRNKPEDDILARRKSVSLTRTMTKIPVEFDARIASAGGPANAIT